MIKKEAPTPSAARKSLLPLTNRQLAWWNRPYFFFFLLLPTSTSPYYHGQPRGLRLQFSPWVADNMPLKQTSTTLFIRPWLKFAGRMFPSKHQYLCYEPKVRSITPVVVGAAPRRWRAGKLQRGRSPAQDAAECRLPGHKLTRKKGHYKHRIGEFIYYRGFIKCQIRRRKKASVSGLINCSFLDAFSGTWRQNLCG